MVLGVNFSGLSTVDLLDEEMGAKLNFYCSVFQVLSVGGCSVEILSSSISGLAIVGGIAHGDPQLCHTPGVLTSPCLQQRRLFINLILFPIHMSACQRHQWAVCEVCRLILDVSRPLFSPLVAIVGHTLECPASATQARIDFLLSPMLR